MLQHSKHRTNHSLGADHELMSCTHVLMPSTIVNEDLPLSIADNIAQAMSVAAQTRLIQAQTPPSALGPAIWRGQANA